MEKKKAQFEVVAEQLIEQMEKGSSVFQKPWENENTAFPYNPKTGNSYRGLNFLALFLQHKTDPRWMTFKQAQAEGYTIKKGSKGTQITYFSTTKEVAKKDEKGKFILDENGERVKQLVRLEKPLISSAWVFNAESIEGIPPLKIEKKEQGWENSQEVENLIKNIDLNLQFGGNRAFYSPSRDIIVMPNKAQFATDNGYYSTLLHEIGHWTGHKDRLDRFDDSNAKFGSKGYALEELRAEIASLMLGSKYSVGKEITQHVAYIKSWIEVLKNDPFELYRASADAQSIVDYIAKFSQKENKAINNNQEGIYENAKVVFVINSLDRLGFQLEELKHEELERKIFDNQTEINIEVEENQVLFDFKITNTSTIKVDSITVTDMDTGNLKEFKPHQGFSKNKMVDLVQGKEVQAFFKTPEGENKQLQISFDFSNGEPELKIHDEQKQNHTQKIG